MAGQGSRGPAAKDASTRQRRNKSSSKAVLSVVTDHDVPAMPPAGDWIGGLLEDAETPSGLVAWPPQNDDGDTIWPEPVVRWWNDIWSSPMSNEFVSSDIHGLYLAAFYLAEALNPYQKLADRLKAATNHESCVRNFGLNPMARRTLQWEVERVKEAQEKGRKRSGGAKGSTRQRPEAVPDPRGHDEEGDENPYATTS